ncbi:MAG: cysteine synthase family protein, partial [Clostridia bacterium]
MIYDSIIETIGKTPLVKLKQFSTVDATVYAKLESFNPSGSSKDRAAYFMINDAFTQGKINLNSVIIEPTSGNTGIGLAMVCSAMRLKLILTMPENMSIERIKILQAYGAEIVLTDKSKGMLGAINMAKELKSKYENSFIPSQFENLSNVNAHFVTTAREIFADLNEISWIVAGVGSGGTIMGIQKYIDTFNIKTKVCAVEPKSSAMLSGGEAGAHKIQGIGANFIPQLIKLEKINAIETVSDDEAFECARNLAKKEGIFAGISSGAALQGVLNLIRRNEKGNFVVVLPDSG